MVKIGSSTGVVFQLTCTKNEQSVLSAAARLFLQLPHRAFVFEIMQGQLHLRENLSDSNCALLHSYRCLHGLAPH